MRHDGLSDDPQTRELQLLLGRELPAARLPGVHGEYLLRIPIYDGNVKPVEHGLHKKTPLTSSPRGA